EGRGGFGAAGAGHEKLHAVERRTNSIQDRCEAALICGITWRYQRSAPKGLALRYRREHMCAPAACRNNVRPRLRQCLNKSKPDTAGPANHNCSLVCEIQKRVAHEKSLNTFRGMNYIRARSLEVARLAIKMKRY